MRVSAVIPTFNRRQYLPRAIDSVLAQTVLVDEIIVIDDGSTDGSADLVKSRYGDRVRVVRQTHAGVSGARHRGVQEAHGEWIAFLDSDDEWLPDRNAEFIKATECVPDDVAWIFGDLRVVTDSGEGLTVFAEHGLSVSESPHIFADPLAVQWPFQFAILESSFIKREALLKIGCFTEGLQHSEDVLAGIQVACRYRVAAVTMVVGRYFRTSDLASSSAMLNGDLADYYRSRILSFEQIMKSGRRRPWNRQYAAMVRGLCQVMARRRSHSRKLAWQQFRYGGVSIKGIAFLGAAVLGPWALQIWDRGAEFARNTRGRLRTVQPSKAGSAPTLGFPPQVLSKQASARENEVPN